MSALRTIVAANRPLDAVAACSRSGTTHGQGPCSDVDFGACPRPHCIRRSATLVERRRIRGCDGHTRRRIFARGYLLVPAVLVQRLH